MKTLIKIRKFIRQIIIVNSRLILKLIVFFFVYYNICYIEFSHRYLFSLTRYIHKYFFIFNQNDATMEQTFLTENARTIENNIISLNLFLLI